ncbi:MAG TPA: PAS domain-containing sensor histidine kinase [Thermoanaerobaculia bacterium]|nr:PAS domain-containing sensor histidine kinase [Thermoanaerobaculia bacterium]
MSLPDARSPRPPWKPSSFHTLWGAHLPKSRISPLLASSVFALSLLGFVLIFAEKALDVAILPSPHGFLGVALPWTSALSALLVAGFAWGTWLTRGSITALVLAGTLPGAALLAGRGALAAWDGIALSAEGTAGAGHGAEAGLVLALGLQLAWAAPWLERLGTSRRRARGAALLLGAALALAGTLALAAGRILTAEALAALILLVLASPAVARLHRSHPNLLTHGLTLALAPLAAAQAALLLSAAPWDSWALLAEAQTVLACTTLLAGVCLDFVATEKAKASIQGTLRQTARELESSTYEVRRVHGELAREQEQKERYFRKLRLLERAVERMSLGLTITDPQGTIIYVNSADAAMHGYTRDELVGEPARVYGAPEATSLPPEVAVCWRRETLNRTRGGQVFPVRLISDAVVGDDGRLQALVTLCEDLTEVQQALEAIEEAQEVVAEREADYRQLVEETSDLIQSVGLDGRFRFVNCAWLKTLGYAPEDLPELSIWDVIHPSQHDHCSRVFADLTHSGRPKRVETVFRSRGEREIQVEGSVGVRSKQGAAVATLGIFRDITERRRVERMKQDFLATVSHELRTPLTSILGSLSLVRSPRLTLQPEKIRELLEIAERNGDRLLRLINDLLDLQRLEAGELRFHPTVLPVAMLLNEAVHDIHGFADLYKVQVRAEASPALSLATDRDRLAQVLYNLLSNAIKFSPPGQEVLLTARQDGPEVEITVRDHGPGIPEGFRNRLFEKFAQADASTVRSHGGSGLGLSISKGIVQGLGGTIAIDSGPETGTTISIRLPCRAA